MKVFCPTLGLRPTRSHKLFPPEWPFTFVVDSEATRDKLASFIHRDREWHHGFSILVVNIEDKCRSTRLAEIRNRIEDQVEMGEWFVEVDDDCGGITMLDPSFQRIYEDRLDYNDFSSREWHSLFGYTARPIDVAVIFEGLMYECERVGTIYGGLSFFDNPFYRKRKFAYAAYVNGGLHVKKKDGRPWRWTPAEDMEMSCYALQKYGATVVNRWAHGLFKDSSEGGVGTFSEEWKHWIAIRINQLLNVYPNLMKRSGDFRLKITKNTPKAIENWRKAHGWF